MRDPLPCDMVRFFLLPIVGLPGQSKQVESQGTFSAFLLPLVIDDNIGMAVGEYGTILLTTAGGGK